MVGNEKNNVFVSYRGRVTQVAPECLRKANVAEQMSWDITTKEKTLFDNALEEEHLSWKQPMLDEPGEWIDAEMPDTVAEPPHLEGGINTPVNDDNDAPVFEPPVAEDKDPNDEEQRLKVPDIVAEGSRDIERD